MTVSKPIEFPTQHMPKTQRAQPWENLTILRFGEFIWIRTIFSPSNISGILSSKLEDS